MEFYYSLTITVDGASTGAYYSIVPTSNLSISQGGVTFAPSSPTQQMTSVSVYPQTLQINAAAGSMSGGVNIITSETRVSGQVVVSPPVDVATVVTLYGNGGQQIGQYIVDPATPGGIFNFTVTPGEGIPVNDAPDVLKKLVEKK